MTKRITQAEKAGRMLLEIVYFLDLIRARKEGKKGDLFGSWVCGCYVGQPDARDPENKLRYPAVIPCERHKPCLIKSEYEKVTRKIVKQKKEQ